MNDDKSLYKIIENFSYDKKNLEECTINVCFNIKKENAELFYNHILKRKSKSISAPGFRSGKVSDNIVDNLYGKDIQKEAVNLMVKFSIDRFMENEQSNHDFITYIINDESIKNYNFNTDFDFSVRFNVSPKIELPNYKNIDVKVDKKDVSKNDIDKKIDFLKEIYGNFEIVTDNSETIWGDKITISYESDLPINDNYSDTIKSILINKKEFHLIKNGKEKFLPSLSSEIFIGRKSGDVFKYSVNYDDSIKELSNLTSEYTFKVVKFTRRKKLNSDDLLCSKLKIDDIAKLRDLVSKQIKSELDYEILYQKRKSVLDFLSNYLDFQVPNDILNDIISSEYNFLIKEEIKSIKSSKNSEVNVESILEGKKDDLSEKAKNIALKKLRMYFLLRSIGKKENIQISHEELNKYIENIIPDKSKIKEISEKMFSSGKINQIMDDLLLEKIIKFIIDHSRVI